MLGTILERLRCSNSSVKQACSITSSIHSVRRLSICAVSDENRKNITVCLLWLWWLLGTHLNCSKKKQVKSRKIASSGLSFRIVCLFLFLPILPVSKTTYHFLDTAIVLFIASFTNQARLLCFSLGRLPKGIEFLRCTWGNSGPIRVKNSHMHCL